MVVVGGGPAGLTAAYYLGRAGHTVALLDAHDELGGCHRVMRSPAGLFAEHAPRVYSDSYVNAAAVLRDLGLQWRDVFREYPFRITTIAARGASGHLGARELAVLAAAFLLLLLPGGEAALAAWSVADVAATFRFSPAAADYLDRVCRLTDGAGADRYSLLQFLRLVDQQALHTLYQPRAPTDRGLFKDWAARLPRTCTVHRRARVTALDADARTVTAAVPGAAPTTWVYKRCILAVPPAAVLAIQGAAAAFPAMTEAWVAATRYLPYISAALHFDAPLPPAVTAVHGFPATPWAIAYVAVSAYWDGGGPGVLSVSVTRPDAVSPVTGKSAQQCDTEAEVVAEVIRQLSETLPLPPVRAAFLTPGTARVAGAWVAPDAAYIAAAGTAPVAFASPTHPDSLFTVGAHTGRSWYGFNAMESAIENALQLSRALGTPAPAPTRPWTVRGLVALALAVVVLAWLTICGQ